MSSFFKAMVLKFCTGYIVHILGSLCENVFRFRPFGAELHGKELVSSVGLSLWTLILSLTLNVCHILTNGLWFNVHLLYIWLKLWEINLGLIGAINPIRGQSEKCSDLDKICYV